MFVVQARFPPDDRSVGYERGTSVSKAWDEATTEGAIEVASYVTDHLEQLAGMPTLKMPRANQSSAIFAFDLPNCAFRRPLAAEQKKLYIDRQFAKVADRISARQSGSCCSCSSRRDFCIAKLADGPTDQFDTASSRLSFGLWDSLPDTASEAAANERQIGDHDRNRPTTRADAARYAYAFETARVFPELVEDLAAARFSKDPKLYPEFTPDVISDLRTSSELSLDDMLNSGSADFRQFLLSDAIYLNGRLAKVYGAKLPEKAPFEKVDFEPEHRAGVLSHPYLLGEPRLHERELADPSRRFSFAKRVGRVLRPPAEIGGAAAAGDSCRLNDRASESRCKLSRKHARAAMV